MKYLDLKHNSSFIFATIFLIIIIGSLLFIKQKFYNTKESFPIPVCPPTSKWDKCLENCELIYDQAKSQICKNKCNSYLYNYLSCAV